MATKTKAEIEKENKELEKQLKASKKEQEQMSKELDSMKEQMVLIMQQMQKQEEKPAPEPEVVKEPQDEIEEFPTIPSGYRVKMVHMLHGGTTLQGAKTMTRFKDFGSIRYARYEDVEDYRYSGKYTKHFENGYIYITDKKVRKALGLDTVNGLEVNPKLFEKMSKSTAKEIKETLDKLSHHVRISFATYFIDGIKGGASEFLDTNKWTILNNYFSINIQDIIS